MSAPTAPAPKAMAFVSSARKLRVGVFVFVDFPEDGPCSCARCRCCCCCRLASPGSFRTSDVAPPMDLGSVVDLAVAPLLDSVVVFAANAPVDNFSLIAVVVVAVAAVVEAVVVVVVVVAIVVAVDVGTLVVTVVAAVIAVVVVTVVGGVVVVIPVVVVVAVVCVVGGNDWSEDVKGIDPNRVCMGGCVDDWVNQRRMGVEIDDGRCVDAV